MTTTLATFDLEPTTTAQRQSWFAQFDAAQPLLLCCAGEVVLGFAYYLPYRPKPAYAATKEGLKFGAWVDVTIYQRLL